MKIILIVLFLVCMPSMVLSDEADLRQIIERAYPDLQIKSIKKTEFDGLYEIYIGGQIIYTDEAFKFLIVEGRLVDPKTKVDLTSQRLEELSRVNFNALPFFDAIEDVRGNGKKKIVIFSDIDCPFCRKLEKETLMKLDDVTIYTFLYPLAIHPEAEMKSKQIWCAKDRASAWNDYMLKGTLPNNQGKCETPIMNISRLGKELGISSTPTIIFASGRRIEGVLSYEELIKHLD